MFRLTSRILSACVAACLGFGSLAVQAQPGPPPGHGPGDMRHGGRHDDRGRHHDNHRHDDRRFDDRRGDNRGADNRFDRRDDRRMRGAGPDHNWQRGYRVPPQYRSHHYVVNDWRGHRLSAPPRGYQWVQNGSDYLLIGIATGVIATMVLGGY
ncbi:RcnB family protein [Comamonas sp. Y33R10-2]|uniref:RcnB family protein n=1 Tax=Comamonas sp. Y33R10-2 TaxID=2853257 RepID=UPI001C5C9122|nr:RcnB family protein [Comamonas sp. Y33R10-2]QXZ09387.1 RcnB family protein [Comamonas sp. Y33R10-2]